MRGDPSSLVLLLSFISLAARECSCFSISHQRHFGRPSNLRNTIRNRPSTTSLNIFPRNDPPASNNSNQSYGANYVSINNGYLESLSSPPKTTNKEDSNQQQQQQDYSTRQPNAPWKDPFSTATSAFSNVVRTGTNDIKSAANAATSGIGAVAQRGSSDFQALANSANFNARKSAVQIRSFARKGTGKVGKVAMWIDSQAKMGTQAIGSQAKSMVVKFTGKENYEFGDIVKETIRRILEQEVSISDTILLLKILLAIGASIGPLAELLPVAVLLQGLNVSLETQIGGKILEALAHSLDNRFEAAFTGDDKFLLGSAAKRSMLAGILAFTGKSTYEAGDIQRAVAGNNSEGHDPLQISVDPELEAWDKAFTESIELQKQREQLALLYSNPDGTPLDEEAAKQLDMELATELEQWSSVFRKDYAEFGL